MKQIFQSRFLFSFIFRILLYNRSTCAERSVALSLSKCRSMERFYNSLLPIAFLLLTFLTPSCTQNKTSLSEKEFKNKYGDTLVKVNKILVKKDEETIRNYIKRREWKMEVSGTGLFYGIYKKGNGAKAEVGKYATIKYNISLIDGTVCYSSDSLGLKTFRISQGRVESGLEEGILLMKEGDKAHLIMPPYMAHGLIGDDNKIPPRSIIIYDVDLIKISD
ncbi:MAG TPA: peptidylprolyl isomerase [Bacteroidales bacterium]|nr:peptidylprolyl isomerase [Bacteroidales bacterium]